MKRPLAIFGAAILLTSFFTSAIASPNGPGTLCKKVGAKAKSGSVSVICAKSGKKLLWKKATAPKLSTPISSASPTPTKSATPTSTPVASATPTPKTSPSSSGVIAQDSYSVNVHAASWLFSFTYSVNGVKSPLENDANHSRVLVLPIGKPVKLNLTNTADVSHGFWIPALGIDKEMAPEVTSAVDVTPSKLGTFPGACNVECGRGMAGMNFTVQVVSEADFLTYLSSL